MLKQFCRVGMDLFGEQDRAVVAAQGFFEQMPSGSIFDVADIVTIEVEEVERIEQGRRDLVSDLSSGCPERLLQQAEIRPTLLVENDCFAIQDHRCWSQGSSRFRNRREPIGPIEAASGENFHVVGFDVNVQPVTVPLALPPPIAGQWWSLDQKGKRRLDAIGHRIKRELWLRRIARANTAALHRGRFVTQQRFRSRRARTLSHAGSVSAKLKIPLRGGIDLTEVLAFGPR